MQVRETADDKKSPRRDHLSCVAEEGLQRASVCGQAAGLESPPSGVRPGCGLGILPILIFVSTLTSGAGGDVGRRDAGMNDFSGPAQPQHFSFLKNASNSQYPGLLTLC